MSSEPDQDRAKRESPDRAEPGAVSIISIESGHDGHRDMAFFPRRHQAYELSETELEDR
jgi:hypothetical protein